MTINAIIIGRLDRPAQRTTDATGFARAVLIAPIREDNASEASSVNVNVVCFDKSAANALLTVEAGGFVGVAGELTQKLNVPPPGEPHPPLELVAHAVIPEYLVGRKRTAIRQESEQPFDADLPGAA